MPIYEYRCLDGHICERFMSIAKYEESKTWDLFCDTKLNRYGEMAKEGEGWEYCGLLLEKIWSLPANITTPDDSKSNFAYFENPKTGEIKFNSLHNKDNWHPHGFIKKEARNHFERLAVESKIRKQSDAKLGESYERDDMRRHFSEEARHSDLNAAISQGAIAVDNPETGNKETVYLDDRTKELLKKGMQHSIDKKPRRKQSDFRLAANHSDSSTLKNQE